MDLMIISIILLIIFLIILTVITIIFNNFRKKSLPYRHESRVIRNQERKRK